ncbi:MAG: methyltransferase [Candidatus Caldatribacteriota bacterium]|nr:methyltransferase [Candidatus Caldatribacteriota bacterium]
MIKLNCDEKIENLGEKKLKIIQAQNIYRFSEDTILLIKFIKIKNYEKIIDLGSGSGIIPILLSKKRMGLSIYGIEIQKKLADMAKKSVKLNKLQARIKIIQEDIKDLKNIFKEKEFDVAVSNPPYISIGEGKINPVRSKAIARHELKCNLEDIVSISSYLLKDKGRIYLIYKTSKLTDIILKFKKYGIEPKKIKFIHYEIKKNSKYFLIEGIKGGKRELKVESPIFCKDK